MIESFGDMIEPPQKQLDSRFPGPLGTGSDTLCEINLDPVNQYWTTCELELFNRFMAHCPLIVGVKYSQADGGALWAAFKLQGVGNYGFCISKLLEASKGVSGDYIDVDSEVIGWVHDEVLVSGGDAVFNATYVLTDQEGNTMKTANSLRPLLNWLLTGGVAV